MKQAFTLVETLIVIAILAVVAVLGTSAARSAMAQAKQVQCANNMRQIGIGLTSYAGDHNGFLPETSHTTTVNRSWIAAFEEEFGSAYDEIRICPADPKGNERRESGGTSYVLNSYLFVPEVGPFGEDLSPPLNNLNRIPEPPRTIMAFIVSDHQAIGATSDHTHSRLWEGNWERVVADIQPDRHRVGSGNSDHTKGSANYLFVDGHVERWDAKAVKSRTTAGENIARPPGVAVQPSL